MKVHFLKKFKLFLNDRTIILHDVKVCKVGKEILVVSNPIVFRIIPVKFLGVCAFDDDGILGRVVRLPRFMWKMVP